ncbi:MAG: hypothetical protein ACE5Q3_16905 [Alphaproteobacteria bacterium]
MPSHPAILARRLATSCAAMKEHLTALQRHLALGDQDQAIAALNALGAEVIRYERRLRELSKKMDGLGAP